MVVSVVMEGQIVKGTYFAVETTRREAEIVPTDLVGRSVAVHVEALLNYLDGSPKDPDALCEIQEGYLAQMAAPGYPIEPTPWTAHKTYEAARAYLVHNYGTDDKAPGAPTVATHSNSVAAPGD